MHEVWKDILGFENKYTISNNGRVYSKLRNIILKQKTVNSGYCAVHLRDGDTEKHPSVHRLVAEHFIDNPLNKNTVNHKDGNKSNNVVNNLEWSTSAEQYKHALEYGLMIPRGNYIYSPDFKLKVRYHYETTNCSIKELGRLFNISERSAGRFILFNKRTNIKLAEEVLLCIINLRESGATLKSIAEKFNCGISQIHRITRGESRNVKYLK